MRCFSNDRVVRCGLIATSQRYPPCLMLSDCAPRFDCDVMVLTTVLRYSVFGHQRPDQLTDPKVLISMFTNMTNMRTN